MSNFILNRIKNQINSSKIKVKTNLPVEVKEDLKETPISPDKLKSIFMTELQEKPQETVSTGEKVFNGIEDFIDWYRPNKDGFTDDQIVALGTLIQVWQLINNGCSCKKAARRKSANDYFKTFWVKNQYTDLPTTIFKIGGYSKITFAVDGEVFLIITSNTLENS